MDDATNVHGIYVRIEKIISPNSLLVKLVNDQQYGFDFLLSKTNVEIVDAQSLITYAHNIVKSVVKVNKEYSIITFILPLGNKVKVNDVIASTNHYPEVLMKGCTVGNNRARGILLGSRAKIVIEDNIFHTPGAAILLEGDARGWFEQSGVRNLIIHNNKFVNCNYGPWGNAVIQTGSGIAEDRKAESKYNQNVFIEDNLFKGFASQILNMYSIDGLTFRNNRIEKTTDYKDPQRKTDAFVVVFSTNVNIKK